MTIKLFNHNQTAYDSANDMLDSVGKAAVIHPTGTGKSMIAFKLVETHPDALFLWLAPSTYIYHTQQENLQHMVGDTERLLQHVIFLTYSKLMHDEDIIDSIDPDYIILDEFHRCGATEWGRSVRKLLEAHSDAKLLGLSATSIRYLDNQRDMAQELFDGCIASEMTLGEAIARGILPAPKYVMGMYSYDEELKKLSKRIRDSKTQSDQAKNKKLFEQLKRALENADGPERIFAKHMPRKDGKYIVFCSGFEHMHDMAEVSRKWFLTVDSKPHIYMAYYNDPGNSKAFKAFKADKSSHLKLLYCIDMLNEGVHVDDIDGVILLRPTVSPIIYMQQIGRCLAAGNTDTPVIFDLVDNFESLYSIEVLRDQIDEAFSMIPCTYGERQKFQERFEVYDELRDCRSLFSMLQNSLSSSWDNYYEAASAYYREYGDLRVVKSYITPEGLTLGSWIQTQRKIYNGSVTGSLTADKIQKLNAIGMIWNVRDSKFSNVYDALVEYYDTYGNLDVKARYVSPDGYKLGKWVNQARTLVKKHGIDNVFDKEQQKQLNDLGMIWDKNEDIWNTYYEAALDYYNMNGNLKVPVKYVSNEGVTLGRWLSNIKSRYKAGQEPLSAEQMEKLSIIGFSLDNKFAVSWNRNYALAKKYYEANGNLNMPVAYTVDGVKLGRWISNIRAKRKNSGSSGMVLDETRIKMLDDIGMNWK